MSNNLNILKKLKRKWKSFKEDECGGDIINNVLILVVTIIIISLLIVFAIAQIDKIGEDIKALGEKWFPSSIRIALSQNKVIFDSESLMNKFCYLIKFLVGKLYINFLIVYL